MIKSSKFTKLFLYLVALLLSPGLTGQNFQFVNNTLPNKGLLSVQFPSVDTGFAAGDSGTILRTIDTGNTWIPQATNTNRSLSSVYFINSNTGWAVGDTGTILKTTDGGSSWLSLNYSNNNYFSVYFLDSDTGYIAGGSANYSAGIIIKTTDGGNNWSLKCNTSYPLHTIYFKTADTGFAGGWSYSVSIDTLLMTADHGNTWTKKFIGSNSFGFTSVKFPSSDTGYVLTDGGSFGKSTDGGSTWFITQTYLVETFTSMYFTSTDTGYALGYSTYDAAPFWGGSFILKTTDGGNTFNILNNVASGLLLTSIWFTNSQTGYIGGENPGFMYGGYSSHTIILKTTNGGATWVKINNPPSEDNVIYPDPATNELNIEYSRDIKNDKITYEITNSEGQIISKGVLFIPDAKIDISQLNIGFYVIKLKSETGMIIKKFIKQ